MSQQDPDVAKYQAALKRSSFQVPRGAIIAVLGVALIGGGWGLAAWRESVHAQEEADAKSREEAEAKSQREKELAEKEARTAPLKGALKANAALDPAAFPEGPIELARGRRVLGIHTSWQVLEPALRARLGMPDGGERPNRLFFPEPLLQKDSIASLARKPEDVGTVVQISTTTATIGTYRSPNALPDPSPGEKPRPGAYQTRYSFVAFVVPENKVVARWSRVCDPPLDVHVTKDGMPLESTLGTLEPADYQADADALFAGRLPNDSTPPAPPSASAAPTGKP